MVHNSIISGWWAFFCFEKHQGIASIWNYFWNKSANKLKQNVLSFMKLQLTCLWISKFGDNWFLILSKNFRQLYWKVPQQWHAKCFLEFHNYLTKTLPQGGNFGENPKFPWFSWKLVNFNANSVFFERSFFREFFKACLSNT